MPNVTFIDAEGVSKVIDIREGLSLMRGATSNGIDGIVGECGGNAMCATCHVKIDAGQQALLPPISEIEDALLDTTASSRTRESRLGCQINVTAEMDGLVVRVPDRQY